MLFDVSSTLRLGAQFLPGDLCGRAAHARLSCIAEVLPPCIAIGTFEARLSADEQVDYQVCFTARSGGRERLKAWLAEIDVHSLDPGWHRSIEFLRAWSTEASLLFVNSPAAWLEFDCRLGEVTPPVPFPFFSLHPPWEDSRIPLPEVMATVDEGFDHLAGGNLDRALREQIHRVLRTMAAGRLIHAALRPVGEEQFARLIIRMPVTEIARELERLGWPDPGGGFADLVRRDCTSKLVHTIQIDVTPAGVGPRVGIEHYYDSSPLQDRRWQNLFDTLLAEGACSAERRRQMETWIGISTQIGFSSSDAAC